ncbi:hypothetical protein AB0H88_30200 [Nonomuraea sp. NPDC050680]|jgi:hypothetical protein|uniref:hypothetical protein n=1 Tax=Nonomuraea sp. NPDC050680 TaxID=3154630 RepID=UPI00340DBC5E
MTVFLAHYLGLLHRSERELAAAFRDVAADHGEEPDVVRTCERLAEQCDDHIKRLEPFIEHYSEDAPDEPQRLHSTLFSGTRGGGLGLLRDLHDLYLMAAECDISWTLIGQAAQGARDKELFGVVGDCEGQTATQLLWLRTRMKQAAPQTLVCA